MVALARFEQSQRLADIFQLIGLQRKTGILTLKNEKDVVTVTFEGGMVVMADRSTVTGNHLLLDAPGAMGIGVNGSHNVLERNRFDGSGSLAVVFAPIAPMKGSSNQSVGSDVSRLKTSRGEFLLLKGANQNRIVGSTGRVADAGEGNVTEGLQPFVQVSK